MSFGNYLALSDNSKIPQIGLGTWMSKPKEVENAVSSPSLSVNGGEVGHKGHVVWQRDQYLTDDWCLG
jgi:hypothetical protein